MDRLWQIACLHDNARWSLGGTRRSPVVLYPLEEWRKMEACFTQLVSLRGVVSNRSPQDLQKYRFHSMFLRHSGLPRCLHWHHPKQVGLQQDVNRCKPLQVVLKFVCWMWLLLGLWRVRLAMLLLQMQPRWLYSSIQVWCYNKSAQRCWCWTWVAKQQVPHRLALIWDSLFLLLLLRVDHPPKSKRKRQGSKMHWWKHIVWLAACPLRAVRSGKLWRMTRICTGSNQPWFHSCSRLVTLVTQHWGHPERMNCAWVVLHMGQEALWQEWWNERLKESCSPSLHLSPNLLRSSTVGSPFHHTHFSHDIQCHQFFFHQKRNASPRTFCCLVPWCL